ncbi:Starch-binding associating with outer membrane [Pedobacter sp. ok626]|uniref:RagB/SusD family nutrient uptake outer membrane protein n=1 Tax=Pedobacter sp. ok626 TaxID=1761882 RepID=UPI00088CF9E2|nr:RagB/SusD family nutrient uptake outer membrane protein [Pedobacter sp. ok626]SDL35382.1 Starch-binding associating with outer membrane [Pedobacter sp. ok626]
MKRHIYIAIIGLTILGSGCKDYLDTKPHSFNTVENLYKTPQDAEIGLTGCYSILNAQSIQGTGFGESFTVKMPIMLNAGTDELVTQDGFTDPNYAPFGTAEVSSQNETIRNNWFYLFAGINRSNYLLENINKANVPEPRKQEIIGEARFLRGLLYFYLATFYGGVPVYETSQQDPKAQRDKLESVYQLILSDFNNAYQNLPNRAGIEGRANKWSAAGYLAKVYTYLGSCNENAVGKSLNFPLNSFDWVNKSEMYANAKSITDKIIAESGYKLTKNYSYLFRETTKSQLAEESLFSIQSKTNSANGNYNLWLFWQIPIGSSVAGGGYGWFRPTGELFFKYDNADERRKNNLTLYVDPQGQKENIEGINYFIPLPCIDPLNGNYCVGKFRYRDPISKSISNGTAWSDADVPLLRFADILLLNAEAKYYTGDEAGARSRLKEVRYRSNPIAIDALTTAYLKANFIDELLDERSRELCFEGWRRIDLIRFGRYESTINSLTDYLGSWNRIVPLLKSNVKPYKIWFPIPKTEIELSPIDQNPKY